LPHVPAVGVLEESAYRVGLIVVARRVVESKTTRTGAIHRIGRQDGRRNAAAMTTISSATICGVRWADREAIRPLRRRNVPPAANKKNVEQHQRERLPPNEAPVERRVVVGDRLGAMLAAGG
jgi:hypothetical protein